MAFLTKKGANYYIVVSNGGKKVWQKAGPSYKQARLKLNEIQRQQDEGRYVAPGKLTVGDYLERWLKEYVYPNTAPTNAQGYDFIIHRHLIPGLGKIPLTSLRLMDIEAYYNDKLKNGRLDGKGPLSAKSVHHQHIVLHSALEWAVDHWGLIPFNPAHGAKLPPVNSPEMQTLDEDEVNRFLEAAKATEYYAVYYLHFSTGMRRSEILALRWTDIDWLYCTVSVNRAYHHLHSGENVTRITKTPQSRRLINLGPDVMLMLKEHREKQLNDRLLNRIPIKDDDLIFSDPWGRNLLPDTVTRAFIRIRNKLGLKVRLYDSRHMHATLLLKAGVPAKVIQERLGHASISTTLNTYSHVTPAMGKEAAEVFDEILKHSTDRKQDG